MGLALKVLELTNNNLLESAKECSCTEAKQYMTLKRFMQYMKLD